MNLPELPRVLHKTEASTTTKVLKWFKENHKKSCVIEIKATKNNTIPQGALQSHQRLALQAANGDEGIIHKLSDESRRRLPFDAFQVVNVPAYVVCCFPKYGYCTVFEAEGWKGAHYDYEGLFRIDL